MNIYASFKNKLSLFFSSKCPLILLVSIMCFVVIVYFVILIFNQLKPIPAPIQKVADESKKAQVESRENTTTELIDKNRKYIVQVFCGTDDGDVHASGVVIGRDNAGDLLVLTNYHVIENFKTYSSGVPSCFIQSQTEEWSEYYYGQPTFYLEEISKEDMELIDFAFIKVKMEPHIKNEHVAEDGTTTEVELTKNLLSLDTFPKICVSNELKIGEELVVLGFPDVSGLGIEALGSTAKFTATEGIVSENVNSASYYFNTSAKIEYGNSGGGAFIKSSGCLAGLPTFVRMGELESLGRILNLNKLRSEFLYKVLSNYSYK